MAVGVSTLLMIVSVVCIFLHRIAASRLRGLAEGLPAAYQQAIAAPPDDEGPAQLIALAIDLSRRQHSTLPFAELTPDEQRLALHAYGIETLPGWMSRLCTYRLRGAERAMLAKLRRIKSSRPVRTPVYFGAIRQQQQLRSGAEH